VVFNGEVVAETTHAQRVLETSHPPVYYIPPEDVRLQYLEPSSWHTFCEFKGRASYVTLRVGDRVSKDAGWTYPDPTPGYETLRGAIAFYPSRVDACFVDDEPVTAQPGDFYGGWITADVVGPFKGGPGSSGW